MVKMAVKLFYDLPGGYKLPSVGLGTSKVAKEEDLENAIDKALEIGYRLIDTAFIYKNEHIIGRVLSKWLTSGKIKREDLFIVSKLPFICSGPDDVENYVNKSLEALQLDYVDLYLIHFPVLALPKEPHETKWTTHKTNHIELWKKLEEQVDAGKIKSLGISNFNKRQIQKLLDFNPRHKIANLQTELHVFLQQPDLVKFCLDNEITVTAFAPLGSPGYNDHLKRTGREVKNLPDILNNGTIEKIAVKHGKTKAQILLRFLLQKNITVIAKSVNAARLQENFDVFSFNLDDVDVKDLTSLDVGEQGRIFTFVDFRGLEENPEWPFDKR